MDANPTHVVPDVPLALLVFLVELGGEGNQIALALLTGEVDGLLDELDLLDDDLLLLAFALHQHRSEVHAALHGHVEVEGEVCLAVLVGDGASVLPLFLLRTEQMGSEKSMQVSISASSMYVLIL